jgi:hypothetical protein
MTKLTSAKRKKIASAKFGLPGERKYPMEDKAHAANAKARASQQVKKGNLSESSKEKIDAKANKVLGHRTLRGIRK